ncbi:MAG: Rrf2 family transcriptional regulator [bacterium]
MRLSTKGRYGVRAMCDIASHYNGEPIALRNIAQRQSISLPYLERLFTKLRKAGLIEAVRGRKGGYLFSRRPAEITVGEICRILEGPIRIVTINHAALNMTDDYYDYRSSIDASQPGGGNEYTGGSGTLTEGLIAPGMMFKAFVLCYSITAAIGIYLTIVKGWPVLAFGLFGMFCSYFYTAPPIKFAYRGFGEVGLLVNFGTVIGMGAYFVQARTLSWEAFWATLPLGIMMFAMITINEIPDYLEDRAGRKLTLVARYGRGAGVKLYVSSLTAAYLIIIGSAAVRVIPPITLIALLTLPFAYGAVRTLVRHYDDPVGIAPANLDTIKVHNFTGILLIISYCAYGIIVGRPWTQTILPLVSVAILYAPVAAMLFKARRDN